MSLLRLGRFKLAMKGMLDLGIVIDRVGGAAAVGGGDGGGPALV